MRHINIILCFLLITGQLFAQGDTSAYNTQRNKINQLLEERSARFSQYDNSLTKRTGIFGLKTKKDMQASNDILTEIVLTDNSIFSELQVLLKYKDFEKKEVEHRAETVEGRIERFQSTITRLQQENDKLKIQLLEQSSRRRRALIYLSFAILALSAVIIYGVRLIKLRKTDI